MENSSLTDAVRLNMSRFGSKMSLKSSFSLQSALLIFMLVFGVLRDHGDAQMDREEANKPPDGADGGAFFALRSCHQQLQGDGGEFFSPDYLCSNPPLWCNWTIQVNPGKRINLHLEDLTPGDVCHLKEDQIHVDEPVSHFGVHKVLQKCWQEVKYTSSSNTLYVVLLIGGWPSPPYRGFYGHYQAFGPLVVYNPPGGLLDGHGQSEPSAGLMDLSEVGPDINSEQVESSPDDSNLMYDYYDQPSAQIPELPWEVLDSHTEVGENHRQASESYNHVTDVPVSTSETSQLGRGFNHSPPSRSVPAVHPASQNHELQRTPTAVRRDVKEASVLPEEAAVPEVEMNTQSWGEEETPAGGPEQAAEDEKWTEVSEASDQNPSFSAGLEPEEQIHLRPDMVEPLSDHRGNSNVRNHSAVPHLPGDQLFEVAVEVTFPQDLESWDDQARSLLLSVKTLISKQLEALHSPLSMSSKRIKRLNAGVLYILWLQIKQSPGGLQGHRAVHSALQGLIAMRVSFRESLETAVIISMSTADVNECGTQLVLCDINADCVNHFGSYSCHCRPGFQDESRLGSGGTVCVDLKAAGCSSGLSAETRGVYVLFFLLSTLILMLLVVAGVMYHHHHRGSFLVRCHSSSSSISPPDLNNNDHHHDHDYSCPADSHLPPPPPPTRGPRGSWTHRKEHYPAVDLPLLRFSPLVPPDGYMEPQENERK